MILVNRRTGQTIATSVEIAMTRRERRRGLLGRKRMEPDAAMVITPCRSIHTISMRFSIDVAFVDREGRVVRIVYGLAPWRIAWAIGAGAVIETAAGTLRRRELLVGDALYLSPAYGPPSARPRRSASRAGRRAASTAWLGS